MTSSAVVCTVAASVFGNLTLSLSNSGGESVGSMLRFVGLREDIVGSAEQSVSLVQGRPAVSVSSLRPWRGPVTGGTQVTVLGTGFVSDMLQCKFGLGVSSGSQAFWMTSSVVVCFTPSSASGAGTVVVEVSGGWS